MKIENIAVRNFVEEYETPISEISVETMVVIAGQNGSGKSRYSGRHSPVVPVYGGYQQNEWHHWMGEFQINFTNKNDLITRRTTRVRSCVLPATFGCIRRSESIRTHCEELALWQTVWRTVFPELYGWSTFHAIFACRPLARSGRRDKTENRAGRAMLLEELKPTHIVGEFSLAPGQNPSVRPSKILEVIFGTFRPHSLGVIDYHGPHRTYGRETLSGINSELDALEQQRSQHALYNYANKYANVKADGVLLHKGDPSDDCRKARGAPASHHLKLSRSFFEHSSPTRSFSVLFQQQMEPYSFRYEPATAPHMT